MKFNNNTERMRHPQASIVPLSLCASSDSWNSDALYRYHSNIEFPDEIISLIKVIQEAPDTLLVYLKENQTTLKTLNKKVGLVIALTQNGSDFSLFNQIKNLLDLSDSLFFSICAEAGNVELMRLLSEAHQEEEWIQEIISGSSYKIFRQAASYGHLEVLHYLAERMPDEFQNMIEEDNYYGFRKAIRYQHLDIVQYLIEQVVRRDPSKLQEMLDYQSIDEAISNQDLSILRYLSEQMPSRIRALVAKNDYMIFRKAAELGSVTILQYLAEQMDGELSAMIAAHDYYAFRKAASNGHLEVVKYIAEHACGQLQNMISIHGHYAFRKAAIYDRVHILQYLAEQAPNLLEDMISAEGYFALLWAAAWGYDDVVYFLISYSTGFAFAESHEQEFYSYNTRFIFKCLDNLRRKKAEYGENHIPLTEEEIKQLFYLARALIRRHAPEEDLSLILELPEVRELAHLAVTPEYPNELLRLAVRLGNQTACNQLLLIPAVQREAEANNFYIDEYEGRINLRWLAQDRESSMTALSQEENARLESLKNHYLEKDLLSPNQVLEELRILLIKRYKENSPKLTVTNPVGELKTFDLPYAWEEFIALSLSKEEKKIALEAYYKNKNHTAWRFLAKPNPWMHPQASYTHRNTSGQWSSFSDYAELIATLFLAAKDENTPGIDDYTIEGRVTQFIDELALIGRAHNWDKKNENQQEYDDLKGDKPSCYSGTKRRLFQSVQGHPLLKQLTVDIVQQELREFVWHHFEGIITEKNHQLFHSIWQKSIDIETLTKEEEAILFETNISKEDQVTWIKNLRFKYGNQVNHYETFLLQKLNLSNQDSHFIHFAYLGLDQLLSNPALQKEDPNLADSMTRPANETNVPWRFFDQGKNKQSNSSTSNICSSSSSF